MVLRVSFWVIVSVLHRRGTRAALSAPLHKDRHTTPALTRLYSTRLPRFCPGINSLEGGDCCFVDQLRGGGGLERL